MKQPTILSI